MSIDEQTPEVEGEDHAAKKAAESRREGPGLIRRYLGRIVTVLYAFTAVSGALLAVLADLNAPQVVAVVGAIAALAPVVIKFLEGVQNYEKAGYSFDLKTLEANAQIEIIAAEARAAAEVGGARAQSRIARPGR